MYLFMSSPQTCYIHVFICRSSQAIRGIPLSWQSAVSWGWCCERAQPRVVFYRDLNTFLLAVVTHSFQTLKMINTSLIHCTHATQMSISMLKEIGWFNLITVRRFSWVPLLSSLGGLSIMSSWFVERKMLAQLLATFNVSAMQAVMLEAFMEAHSRQKSLEAKQLNLSKVNTGATLSVYMHPHDE